MGLKIKFGGGVDWVVYGVLRKAQGLRIRLETAYCGQGQDGGGHLNPEEENWNKNETKSFLGETISKIMRYRRKWNNFGDRVAFMILYRQPTGNYKLGRVKARLEGSHFGYYGVAVGFQGGGGEEREAGLLMTWCCVAEAASSDRAAASDRPVLHTDRLLDHRHHVAASSAG